MDPLNQSKLLEKIKYSIAEQDPGESRETLNELKKRGSDFGLPKQAILQLKFIAFPTLSDEECVEILKNNYLESFALDFSMKDKLTAKLFFYPYGARDEIRRKFKKALTENQQKIGPLSISQWIEEFEKSPEKNKKPALASIDFISKNQKSLVLAPIEKRNLKNLLYTYSYLLAVTIPITEPNLSKVIATNNNESVKIFYPTTKQDKQKQESITMPLSEALEKHPELGEQLITSNRLKLKNYPEPARPSIKNWLSDYTFNLGFSSHSAIDRGTYLFKNENAKVLNSSDRERLSFILKAYDEKSLVDINTNTNQIVFPQNKPRQSIVNQNTRPDYGNVRSKINQQPMETNRPTQSPKTASQPNRLQEIYNRQKETDEPLDIFEKTKRFTGDDNYSLPKTKTVSQAKNLNFSSPQRFSHEKQHQENKKNNNQASSNNNVPPGNVVNLKDR